MKLKVVVIYPINEFQVGGLGLDVPDPLIWLSPRGTSLTKQNGALMNGGGSCYVVEDLKERVQSDVQN